MNHQVAPQFLQRVKAGHVAMPQPDELPDRLDANWEIAFTPQFRDGLRSLPIEVHEHAERLVQRLRIGPGHIPGRVKKMNGSRNPPAYRARLGGDYRAVYRPYPAERRVVLVCIGHRKNVYESPLWTRASLVTEPASPLASPTDDVYISERPRAPKKPKPPVTRERMSERDPPRTNPEEALEPQAELDTANTQDDQLDWICEEELLLLQIPESKWAKTLGAGSATKLRELGEEGLASQIEDYLTSPEPNEFARLFKLAGQDGVTAIVERSLESFMLALDPDQRRAVNRSLESGPLLVKGGPGTGKSLVGLYRMAEIIQRDLGRTLFDNGTPRYGCLTYTNTLADANSQILAKIVGAGRGSDLEVQTFDTIARSLAHRRLLEAYGRDLGNIWSESDITGALERLANDASRLDPAEPTRDARPALKRAAMALTDVRIRPGLAYVAQEIEHVIEGSGLSSLDEYKSISRIGRRLQFPASTRERVWLVYDAFRELKARMNAETWGSVRRLALEHLQHGGAYEKFAALFVDEVQDLPLIARKVAFALVRDRRLLTFSQDTGQSIFTYPPPWSAVESGLSFQGKTVVLARNYRTSIEINRAIAPLRGELADGTDSAETSTARFHGDRPTWCDIPATDHCKVVVDLVTSIRSESAQRINLGQVAVILRDASQLQLIAESLRSHSIRCSRVSKDNKIDLTASSVHLVLSTSAKGLEFPYVLVPFVSDSSYPVEWKLKKAVESDDREELIEAERRLLYVALSRAQRKLYMIVDKFNPSRFTGELDRTLWA